MKGSMSNASTVPLQSTSPAQGEHGIPPERIAM
jgi:hypothetical protein